MASLSTCHMELVVWDGSLVKSSMQHYVNFVQDCTILVGLEVVILLFHIIRLLLCAVSVAVSLAFLVYNNLSICTISRNSPWSGMAIFPY